MGVGGFIQSTEAGTELGDQEGKMSLRETIPLWGQLHRCGTPEPGLRRAPGLA